MDHLGIVMDRRMVLTEPVTIDLLMGIGQTRIIFLGMVYSWIHLIGDAVDMGFILVLIQTCTMVIITIILTRGMRGDTF